MKINNITGKIQRKPLKANRDYDKASIPMLSNWSKKGDQIALQQLLKLCKMERK